MTAADQRFSDKMVRNNSDLKDVAWAAHILRSKTTNPRTTTPTATPT